MSNANALGAIQEWLTERLLGIDEEIGRMVGTMDEIAACTLQALKAAYIEAGRRMVQELGELAVLVVTENGTAAVAFSVENSAPSGKLPPVMVTTPAILAASDEWPRQAVGRHLFAVLVAFPAVWRGDRLRYHVEGERWFAYWEATSYMAAFQDDGRGGLKLKAAVQAAESPDSVQDWDALAPAFDAALAIKRVSGQWELPLLAELARAGMAMGGEDVFVRVTMPDGRIWDPGGDGP